MSSIDVSDLINRELSAIDEIYASIPSQSNSPIPSYESIDTLTRDEPELPVYQEIASSASPGAQPTTPKRSLVRVESLQTSDDNDEVLYSFVEQINPQLMQFSRESTARWSTDLLALKGTESAGSRREVSHSAEEHPEQYVMLIDGTDHNAASGDGLDPMQRNRSRAISNEDAQFRARWQNKSRNRSLPEFESTLGARSNLEKPAPPVPPRPLASLNWFRPLPKAANGSQSKLADDAEEPVDAYYILTDGSRDVSRLSASDDIYCDQTGSVRRVKSVESLSECGLGHDLAVPIPRPRARSAGRADMGKHAVATT